MAGKKGIGSGLAAIAVMAVSLAPFVWGDEDTVYPGVSLQEEAVGGMTRAELQNFMDEKAKAYEGERIILHLGKVKDGWSMKDLAVTVDSGKVEDILKRGTEGDVFTNWMTRWKLLLLGENIELPITYDKTVLAKKVAELVETYGKEPEEATPVIDGDGHVSFTKGRPHISLDKDTVYALVEKALEEGKYTVEVPVTGEVIPRLTAEDAKQFNTVLGSYRTHFGASYNRSENIRIATEAISHHIIPSGGRFSFNDTTGCRSPEKGYLEAPVMVGSKLEPGYGGGVCQVSTTLFNAVVMAGLSVSERECHYEPVSYVPMGHDATVSYGDLDFAFTNSFARPVYLYAVYEPGAVTCYILGDEKDKPVSAGLVETHAATLPHKTVEKINPTQKEEKIEESGHDGYEVTVRQYATWADGRSHEDSFHSRYEAEDTIITYKEKPKTKEEIEAAKKKELKIIAVKEKKTAGKGQAGDKNDKK